MPIKVVCVCLRAMQSIFPPFGSHFCSTPTPVNYVLIHHANRSIHRLQMGVPYESKWRVQPSGRQPSGEFPQIADASGDIRQIEIQAQLFTAGEAVEGPFPVTWEACPSEA
jgi:hypothetical protein